MKSGLSAQRFIASVATFAFLGPLIGGIAFMPALLLLMVVPPLAVIALITIYGFGTLPALLTGGLFALLSMFIRGRAWLLSIAALIGGVMTFVFLSVAGHGAMVPAHPAPMPASLKDVHVEARLIFAGAFAALACGWVSQRLWKKTARSHSEGAVA